MELLQKQLLTLDKTIHNFWNTTIVKTIHCKCPNQNCNGFILQGQDTCTSCNVTICQQCLDICHPNKKCNDNIIKSIQLLKEETQTCPGCGIRIYKIEGCYQMWCTNCHTTFHYRTGQILNETTHNPHYIEWRQSNTKIAISEANLKLKCTYRHESYTLLLSIRQFLNELQLHVFDEQYKLNKLVRPQKRHEIRIKYILNKISKHEFQKILYNRFKQISKQNCIMKLFENIQTIFESYLYHYIYRTMTLVQIVDELKQFIKNFNKESVRLQKIYSNSFPKLVMHTHEQIKLNSNIFFLPYIQRIKQLVHECQICCELQKCTIKCNQCAYIVCKACFTTFITSSIIEAQCIHCHASFNRDVLVTLLGKRWYESVYKHFLFTILFQQEQLLFDKSCQLHQLQEQRTLVYNLYKKAQCDVFNSKMK